MTKHLIKHQPGTPATAALRWILASFFLFLILCLNLPDSNKILAILLMPATVFLGICHFPLLKERINPSLFLLTLITVMGGISTAYAVSGKFALQGFLALVIALCCAWLLTLLPQRSSISGYGMASVLAGASSWISVFSLDLVSTRLLSTPFLSLLSQLNPAYTEIDGVEESIRINSIYEAPNVFAGCAGIGVLLCLILSRSTDHKKERRLWLTLLYVNAMAFVLSFSMGATASITVAFIVYWMAETRERRRGTLLLMAETFLLVLAGLPFASASALAPWDGIQPIPLLTVATGSVLLWFADDFMTKHQKRIPSRPTKQKFLIGLILSLFSLGYILTACLYTGGATLVPGNSLHRAIYLDPGPYALTPLGTDGISVSVESQNRQEAMMHTSTTLYEGNLDSASFSVPEDSLVVSVTFSSDVDAALSQVLCTQTSTQSSQRIPLDYPLLPDFIVNRMQGLFANENLLQRLVFFEDGLKLFKERPLIGLGLGAFESSLLRIQSFYYETKYVHNHYIQTLLETGLLGTTLFLLLLGVSGLAILRARKAPNVHPFTAGLAALLLFMILHAGVEVIFSSGVYLPLAFGVFALIGLCCQSVFSLPKKLCTSGVILLSGLLLSFSILLGCNLYARSVGHHADSLDDYQQAAAMDPFEWTDYAISYVVNSPAFSSAEVDSQAQAYIERLDQETSNTIHYYLSQYYFQTGNMEQAMAMAEKQARHTISSSDWWNTLYAMIYAYDDGSRLYQKGIQNLSDIMHNWNEEHMGQIVLEESVQAFVNQVLTR